MAALRAAALPHRMYSADMGKGTIRTAYQYIVTGHTDELIGTADPVGVYPRPAEPGGQRAEQTEKTEKTEKTVKTVKTGALPGREMFIWSTPPGILFCLPKYLPVQEPVFQPGGIFPLKTH